MEDSKSNADVGALVLRIEQLEAQVQKLQGQSGGGKNGGDTLTIDEIKKMTPAQINKRWDEIKKALEGGK